MAWASLILALVKLLGGLVDLLDKRQMLNAGAKAQIGDALASMQQRMLLARAIEGERRTEAEDEDELRGHPRND